MRTNPVFSTEQVVPALKSSTAFEAIDELLDHLVRTGRVSPAEKNSIAIEIKKRELTMSTGIGFGIAIPHAYSDLFAEIVVVFGRSAKGIDFSALDGQPVKFAALVVVPTQRRQQYLCLLNCIARSLHDRDIRLQLESASDAEAIVQILNPRSIVS
jgi:mannitol/fructose-specific phosphotransferase system IIA component (Ntr-type)